MTENEIIEAIIDSARKTTQWPKGHRNYDPIDLINLKNWVKKYDKQVSLLGRSQDTF